MADLDEYKQNIKDLAETRKIKQTDSHGGAGTVSNDYTEIKPVTFKEKWDNYWYHYKVATWVGLLIFIFVIASFLDSMNRIKYDAGLAFVTETPFESNAQFVSAEWKELCSDNNSDGEVNLKVFTVQLDVNNNYSLDAATAEAEVTKFMGNIAVMSNMLYVVDDVGYSSLLECDVILHDLSNIVDSQFLVDGNYKYPLKDTELAKKVGIGNVLDNMYLCLVSFNDLTQKRQENSDFITLWENELAFFEELVNYN